MPNFPDLYSAHLEQLHLRYPDAYHIRPAWGVDLHRIESKVYLADDTLVFVSVLTLDGTIRHFAQPYKIARSYGLFVVKHTLRRMLFRLTHLYGQD
jgi:hypothetical protein